MKENAINSIETIIIIMCVCVYFEQIRQVRLLLRVTVEDVMMSDESHSIFLIPVRIRRTNELFAISLSVIYQRDGSNTDNLVRHGRLPTANYICSLNQFMYFASFLQIGIFLQFFFFFKKTYIFYPQNFLLLQNFSEISSLLLLRLSSCPLTS